MIHIGYAVGLTVGFFQIVYLSYKLDKNFKSQLQKIDNLNDRANEIHKRLESIRIHPQ